MATTSTDISGTAVEETRGLGEDRAAVACKRSFFVRSLHAGGDIQFFVVTAVATILTVRGILDATGWPQLGGGQLHVAHLLWGGLGMLIALVLFMAMQGRLWKQLATLAAGIGFGLFIDELGKFITSDSNYFFRPTVALIYMIFVVLLLVARALTGKSATPPQTALANALDVAKEAVVRDLDETERAEALALLARCDQHDPVVQDLGQLLRRMRVPPRQQERASRRLRRRVGDLYTWIVTKRWFEALLVGYLVVIAVTGVLWAIALVVAATDPSEPLRLNFWSWGQVVSAVVSGALVIVGFVGWGRSRLTAYHWFERALLVTIFVTEFFAFYQNQIAQVFGLMIVLLTYAAIRGMIGQEEALEAERVAHRMPDTRSVPDTPRVL